MNDAHRRTWTIAIGLIVAFIVLGIVLFAGRWFFEGVNGGVLFLAPMLLHH
jgi:hypothetical protein